MTELKNCSLGIKQQSFMDAVILLTISVSGLPEEWFILWLVILSTLPI
jgi:hypothetical protein